MATDKTDHVALYRKRQLVGMMYALKAVKKGNFKLSSGKESEFYVDGRLAALDPETLALVAPQMGQIISEYQFDSVGCMEGPGSTTLLGALLIGYGMNRMNMPVSGFVVRKQAKAHGTGRMLEGVCGNSPILIDDVATSGKSIIHAAQNMPVKPVVAVVILDREEGAKEVLLEMGITLRSILTLKDLAL